jgi:hypothetical protein
MKNFFRFLLIVNLCFIAQSNTAPCFAQGAAGVSARPAQRAMRLPPTSYATLSPVYLPPVSTSSVDLDIVDRGSNNIGIDPNSSGSQSPLVMNNGSYYAAGGYAPNSNWGNPGAVAAPAPTDQSAYGTLDPASYSTCDPSVYGSCPTAYGSSDPAAYGSCFSIGSCGGYSSCGSTGYSSCSGYSSCAPQSAGCSGVPVYSSGCAPCATSCPWSLGGL